MKLSLALLAGCCVGGFATSLLPQNLRVDFLPSPAVVTINPISEFSWSLRDLAGASRALSQASYHLELALNSSFSSLVYDSGSVQHNATKVAVDISAVPSDTTVYWRVCVGGSDGGGLSQWSSASFLRGLATADFTASWIAPAVISAASQPVRLRAVVPAVPSDVTRAMLYIASPCYWHVFSSGVQLDAGREMGSYTVFEERVLYSAFDVTAMLQGAAGGPWAVGVRAAPGPYGEKKFGFAYEGSPLLLEVRVTTADGVTTVLASGSPSLNFTAHADSIAWYNWYLGEVVDARIEGDLEVSRIVCTHYDARVFRTARVLLHRAGTLQATMKVGRAGVERSHSLALAQRPSSRLKTSLTLHSTPRLPQLRSTLWRLVCTPSPSARTLLVLWRWTFRLLGLALARR
jgi:hypothetical protein